MNSLISRIFKKKTELQKALDKCSRSAREGYRVAKDNLDGIKVAIDGVSEDLKQQLASLNDGNVQTSDIEKETQEQLQKVVLELYSLHEKQVREIKENHVRLDKFSVALFGRTMTGKSTLMEILTNGDGSSIGKGGQRTTRDVRSYSSPKSFKSQCILHQFGELEVFFLSNALDE